MPSLLRVHLEDAVARIELLGEDGLPRLSSAMLDELDSAFSRWQAEPDCQGIVVHGSDKAFAAGAEIGEVGALSGVAALDFARRAQLLFERIAQADKPVIAAVSGYCLGGGLDLALACHVRLATPDVGPCARRHTRQTSSGESPVTSRP